MRLHQRSKIRGRALVRENMFQSVGARVDGILREYERQHVYYGELPAVVRSANKRRQSFLADGRNPRTKSLSIAAAQQRVAIFFAVIVDDLDVVGTLRDAR